MRSPLINDNTRMALASIKSNKTRSLLTMIGIIIGVSSVIMTISMGEGIRRQVMDTNQATNDHLISVRSGSIATRDSNGNITDVNYLASLGNNTLTEQDYESLKNLPATGSIAPLSTISGIPSNFEGQEYKNATIIATTSRLPDLIDQKVLYGGFFNDDNSGKNSVVIGKRVAEELFNENVPLGKLITIRGQDFVVGGVFDEFKSNPLSSVADLNKAIFMSYPTAKTITNSNPAIYQILITPKEGVSLDQLRLAITEQLLKNHGGQEDFTVLKASETELVARKTVSAATTFVSAIAAISLVVGGIGIMNIMFVSVTERTREIGVRKSLGATNRQIYSQFLVEASVVSTVGGLIGVLVAVLGNLAVRLSSELQPVITWQIILLSVGVSIAVGIVFGTAPAIKAARKDPIESLRYE